MVPHGTEEGPTPFATSSPPQRSSENETGAEALKEVAGNRLHSAVSGYPSHMHPDDKEDQRNQGVEARKLFRLPADQDLVATVFCSMKRQGIYYNGNLYLFRGFIGFSSTSFGAARLKIVPLETVRAIRMRRHYGDANALEIKWASSKYAIFANLRDRDSILKIMLELWHTTNPEAFETFMKTPAMRETWRNKKFQKLRDLLGMQGSEDSEGDAATVYGDDADERDSVALPTGESTGVEETAIVCKEAWIRALSNPGACPEDSPPALPADAALIGEGTLPYSLHHYINTVHFSEFMREFQDSQNSKDVTLSQWEAGESGTLVRNMEFTVVKKNPIGPSQFRCYQQQRLSIFNKQHVIFQTELVMPDIPYGEYFHVCSRWDFIPTAPQEMSWKMYGWCDFVKSTVFKGKIVSNTISNQKENVKMQMEVITKTLAEKQTGGTSQEAEVQRSLQSLLRTVPANQQHDFTRLIEARLKGDKVAVYKLLNLSDKGARAKSQSTTASRDMTLGKSGAPSSHPLVWVLVALFLQVAVVFLYHKLIVSPQQVNESALMESVKQLVEAASRQLQSAVQCVANDQQQET